MLFSYVPHILREPAWNTWVDEIFWVVTFISLKSSLPGTPRGEPGFYLSSRCHLHAELCVTCVSQTLPTPRLFRSFLKCWAYPASLRCTGTQLPAPRRAAWNENRQAGITGTLRSGKVPLAWGSRKAREGLEDLRKERAESGGEPGEGGAN